jgi:ketosteroid isomerase-like protein
MREMLLEVATEDFEWWIPGDPALLPWAGTWRGREALIRQTELLHAALAYTEFELLQIFADADEVVVISRAGGHAKVTGRRFSLETARVFTVRDGKVTRVRTYSDTGAYLAALGLTKPPT